MTKISVEIVPRDKEYLLDELNVVKQFKEIDIINIPELLRYDIHSWEGCKIAKQYFNQAIPHIRAIDIDLDQPLPMVEFSRENNINEVLVVTGDPPQDMGRKIYPTISTDVIRKFKMEMPEVKVYAGIDQYRTSMRAESYSIKRKIQAGADGFFTQPFFDLRFLEIYAELLEGKEVYWGVSPVLSDKSVNYWETKNNVVFPKNFAPTLEWNIDFAQKVLEFVTRTNSNIYFMPIRTKLADYFSGILAKK